MSEAEKNQPIPILDSGNWEQSLEILEDMWNIHYGTLKISEDRKVLTLTTGRME